MSVYLVMFSIMWFYFILVCVALLYVIFFVYYSTFTILDYFYSVLSYFFVLSFLILFIKCYVILFCFDLIWIVTCQFVSCYIVFLSVLFLGVGMHYIYFLSFSFRMVLFL